MVTNTELRGLDSQLTHILPGDIFLKQCSQTQPIIGQSSLGQGFHTSLGQLVNLNHLWSEMPKVNNQMEDGGPVFNFRFYFCFKKKVLK